jgi:hypothetical protein
MQSERLTADSHKADRAKDRQLTSFATFKAADFAERPASLSKSSRVTNG